MANISEKVKLHFEYANHYGHRQNDIPVFLRCNGVKGSLEVDNQSDKNVDKIKIVLKGTLMNSLGHHGDCTLHWEPQRFVCESTVLDLVEAHDWPANEDVAATDESRTASFSFDFPLVRKMSLRPGLERTSSMTYPILPSSVSATGYGCRDVNNRFSCSATTQVNYELQAYAYNDDELIGYLASPIALFDTEIPSPPPIYQGHFQGEYACSKQKHLSKLAIRHGKLTIKASEPAPLEIKPRPEGGVLMAAMPVRLCLQSDSKRSTKQPPALSVAVTSILKTSTYLSICKLHAHPTLAASQDSPYLSALNKHASKRVRNLTVDGWQRDHEKEPVTWTHDLTMLVPVIENCFPAPSFFTPFIARRYTLMLRLDVKSTWGDAAFRLSVPLQMVYPECPINYEHIYNPHLIEEHTSSSDSLPVYIR